jgi:deoxyribonuclease V
MARQSFIMGSRRKNICPGEDWNVTPREAMALQRELADAIEVKPLPQDFEVLGAADIAYLHATHQLVAVIVTFCWPHLELKETVHVVSPIHFPYVPGLLSFREVPPLLEAFDLLKHPPEVFLCDGQGVAHPRRLGFAAHLGLCLGIPTVGCAKKRLCGEHQPFELHRGNHSPLIFQGEVVGCVYCSREGVKPIFISHGHLANLESSVALVKHCLGRFRLPEPLRQAHQVATRLRRKLGRSSSETSFFVTPGEV